MRQLVPILITFIFLLGCHTKYEDSKIEVIKYDTQLVDSIQTHFDSTYQELLKRDDFWSIDHYVKDSVEYKIMKDSVGNVVAIVHSVNDVVQSGREYYPNGQLEGKTNFPPGKIDGKAVYFYEDGRIRSTGLWRDYRRVGDWFNYDRKGKLRFIEHFDDEGNLKKKEHI